MTFLFANLKDRDFLVQRISDFLQQTSSKIYFEREITGSLTSSDDEVNVEFLHVLSSSPNFAGLIFFFYCCICCKEKVLKKNKAEHSVLCVKSGAGHDVFLCRFCLKMLKI